MNNTKLVVIDCDGVLYHPSELNVNAMAVHAFSAACKALNIPEDMDAFIEVSKQPNFYNYIDDLANRSGITADDFISKMVEQIDYSGLVPDTSGVLQKIKELADKYQFCICTNNHLIHVNRVLQAKFGILSDQLPCEVFDTTYARQDGKYYSKQSDIFISKLEKHFGIDAANFLWIDDSPDVINRIKSAKVDAVLVTDNYRLIDILNSL